PNHYAGGLTGDASDKLVRMVDLCDQFHLPVVNMVDQPGFVIVTQAERANTIRPGVRAMYASYQATVPWVSILVRKGYGVARSGATGRSAHTSWSATSWRRGRRSVAFGREFGGAPPVRAVASG